MPYFNLKSPIKILAQLLLAILQKRPFWWPKTNRNQDVLKLLLIRYVSRFKLNVFPKSLFINSKNMKHFVTLALAAVLCSQCAPSDDIPSVPVIERPGYQIDKKGRLLDATTQDDLYVDTPLDTFLLEAFSAELEAGLLNQKRLLNKYQQQSIQKFGNLRVGVAQLSETIDLILNNIDDPSSLKELLNAYQIAGNDDKGHVKFTGYYTPIIKVKKKKDSKYRYPIYKRPTNMEGNYPSRQQIDGEGALTGMGLELGYAADLVDLYYMMVQGSGYVHYQDTGEKHLLSYDGTNRHKYRSIEKYLAKNSKELGVRSIDIKGVKRFFKKRPDLRDEILYKNPSYTFFKKAGSKVKGAGQVPLTDGISIAVDKRYIPLGSCVLASVPMYDENGDLHHHEYRIKIPRIAS